MIKVLKETVNAKPRNLSVNWTIEPAQELQSMNNWALSDQIKEMIERDMLLKVLDDADKYIFDCLEALEDKAFLTWLEFNMKVGREELEAVQMSYKMLATACSNISKTDEFTLTVAGMTRWPEQEEVQKTTTEASKLAEMALALARPKAQ